MRIAQIDVMSICIVDLINGDLFMSDQLADKQSLVNGHCFQKISKKRADWIREHLLKIACYEWWV